MNQENEGESENNILPKKNGVGVFTTDNLVTVFLIAYILSTGYLLFQSTIQIDQENRVPNIITIWVTIDDTNWYYTIIASDGDKITRTPNGHIGDIRIYDRSLTQQDIEDLYNKGTGISVTPTESNVVDCTLTFKSRPYITISYDHTKYSSVSISRR